MGISKKVLGIVVSVAVMLGAAIWGCRNFSFGLGGSEYKVVETISSPAGNHVATKWTSMGGGAAGWCSQRVSINRGYDLFDLEKEKEAGRYVFSSSCSSKVTLEWRSENEAHISYTMDMFGVSVYQKPGSEYDSDVKISYEVKNEFPKPSEIAPR